MTGVLDLTSLTFPIASVYSVTVYGSYSQRHSHGESVHGN
jgi:hypothetical protein